MVSSVSPRSSAAVVVAVVPWGIGSVAWRVSLVGVVVVLVATTNAYVLPKNNNVLPQVSVGSGVVQSQFVEDHIKLSTRIAIPVQKACYEKSFE